MSNMPISRQFTNYQLRTEPGSGIAANDDGESKVKLKSIPNLATPRLERGLAALHESVHTPDGIRAWEQPRKFMVETSMRSRMIAHELRLRGEEPGDCQGCWG